MRITVLGAGLVGSAIVADLAQETEWEITAVDRDDHALAMLRAKTPAQTVQTDLNQAGAVNRTIEDADLVICAVPGFMGFETLKQVISAGKNVVDISFFGVEKTLRYPGHADLMRIFRESGFFDAAPVQVEGQQVRPIALTSTLLFDQWKLEPGQQDLTVMQVVIEGDKASARHTYTYDLLDRYDTETQTTSMARTTGYTCAIVARQVARGLFAQKGICPPEYVGRDQECYQNLMAEYAKRNIQVQETIAKRMRDD